MGGNLHTWLLISSVLLWALVFALRRLARFFAGWERSIRNWNAEVTSEPNDRSKVI